MLLTVLTMCLFGKQHGCVDCCVCNVWSYILFGFFLMCASVFVVRWWCGFVHCKLVVILFSLRFGVVFFNDAWVLRMVACFFRVWRLGTLYFLVLLSFVASAC